MLSNTEKTSEFIKDDIYTINKYVFKNILNLSTYFTKYFTFFPIKDLVFFLHECFKFCHFLINLFNLVKKKLFHTTELHYQ